MLAGVGSAFSGSFVPRGGWRGGRTSSPRGLGPSSAWVPALPAPYRWKQHTHSHRTSSSFFAPQNSEPENLRPGRRLREHFPDVETAPEEGVRPGVTCRKRRDRQDQNPAELGCTTLQTLSPEPRFPLLSRREQRAQPWALRMEPAQITEQVVLMGPEQMPQKEF